MPPTESMIDGYFPDTSTTNGYFGWFHDAQFLIRLPDNWNGKLVITGAPGVRRQYANDYLLSDWFVARGYAYASTDKGNSGTSFQNDGVNPAMPSRRFLSRSRPSVDERAYWRRGPGWPTVGLSAT